MLLTNYLSNLTLFLTVTFALLPLLFSCLRYLDMLMQLKPTKTPDSLFEYW